MLKYFLKPLGVFDIIEIVLILTWFLLFLFNKGKKLRLSIFLVSHILFYISIVILNKGNMLVPSGIILLVSFIAFIIRWLKEGKETKGFFKNILVYCYFTIALLVFFFFGCVVIEASSILMPPPH